MYNRGKTGRGGSGFRSKVWGAKCGNCPTTLETIKCKQIGKPVEELVSLSGFQKKKGVKEVGLFSKGGIIQEFEKHCRSMLNKHVLGSCEK